MLVPVSFFLPDVLVANQVYGEPNSSEILCLFVSKKTQKEALVPQSSVVLIVLVIDW